MDFCLYILYSEKSEKFYIGCTQNLLTRFISHNSLGTKGWTIKHRPWKVVHIEFFSEKSQALMREKEIKNWKSKARITKLIHPPVARWANIPKLCSGRTFESCPRN